MRRAAVPVPILLQLMIDRRPLKNGKKGVLGTSVAVAKVLKKLVYRGYTSRTVGLTSNACEGSCAATGVLDFVRTQPNLGMKWMTVARMSGRVDGNGSKHNEGA